MAKSAAATPSKKSKKEIKKQESESESEASSAQESSSSESESESGSGSGSDSESDKEEKKKETESGSDSDSSSDSGSDSESEAEAEVDTGKRKASDEDSDADMASNDEESTTEVVAKKQKTDAEEETTFSVFVGNLPWSATNESMEEAFSSYGKVLSARIALDGSTGRSRGFGYVDFADAESRDKAINGGSFDMDGRDVRVDKAEKSSSSKPARGDANAPSNSTPSATLFIGNMSFNTTEDSLREAFAECGTVVSARIPTDRDTGRMKGFGYIEFDSVEAATEALKYNNTDLDGRNIRLDYSTPRTGGGESGGRGGGRGGFRGGRGGGGFRGGNGGGRGGRGGGFRGGRGGGGRFGDSNSHSRY